MRRTTLKEIARELPDEPELPPPGPLVEFQGPRAAGWLVRRYRSKFRKVGAVEFTIPAKKKAPVWFVVAIECLRRRPGWAVDVLVQKKQRTYRVRWLLCNRAANDGAGRRIGRG